MPGPTVLKNASGESSSQSEDSSGAATSTAVEERLKKVASSQCSTLTPVPDTRRHSAASVSLEGMTCGPDSFDIVQVLGKGSFGAVYEVIHKETGGVYALKVLKKEHIFTQSIVRYALTERNVQASVRHPFIVALYGAFQTSKELAMVMQYCPGGTLERLVKKQGRLQEVSGQLYFAQIFLAIEHLHANAIVYRDLKCENVVMDENLNCMLTDFGLSKEGVTLANPTASFVGSTCHVTPDILAKQGHGPPVDIYGLGVILFEMLTGKPPFYARSKHQIFKNVAEAELVVPDYVTSQPASLIQALMCRKASDRLGAAHTPEVRSHPFVAELDLDKVLLREVPVPALRDVRLTPSLRQPSMTSLQSIASEKPSSVCESPFHGRFSMRRRTVEGWDFPEAPPGEPSSGGGLLRASLSSRTSRLSSGGCRGSCLFGFRSS